MKIPKKIKVGGSVYKIKNVKFVQNSEDFYGLTNYRDKEIELRKDLCKTTKEETLLHEIVHALFFHLNLDQQEDLVERLAQALHMFIKDNPEIFR